MPARSHAEQGEQQFGFRVVLNTSCGFCVFKEVPCVSKARGPFTQSVGVMGSCSLHQAMLPAV